jgi:hypothetical protein
VKAGSLLHRCRAVCAAIALGASAFVPIAQAENAPRIDALHVAKLASAYLATHGKDAPYIVSIALEKDALLKGGTSWIVRWSRPLLTDGNKEVGMRVKPDGSVSYLIEDKSARKQRAVPLKS